MGEAHEAELSSTRTGWKWKYIINKTKGDKRIVKTNKRKEAKKLNQLLIQAKLANITIKIKKQMEGTFQLFPYY